MKYVTQTNCVINVFTIFKCAMCTYSVFIVWKLRQSALSRDNIPRLQKKTCKQKRILANDVAGSAIFQGYKWNISENLTARKNVTTSLDRFPLHV